MVVGKLNEMKIKTLSVNFKMKKKNENKERKKDKDGENWGERAKTFREFFGVGETILIYEICWHGALLLECIKPCISLCPDWSYYL